MILRGKLSRALQRACCNTTQHHEGLLTNANPHHSKTFCLLQELDEAFHPLTPWQGIPQHAKISHDSWVLPKDSEALMFCVPFCAIQTDDVGNGWHVTELLTSNCLGSSVSTTQIGFEEDMRCFERSLSSLVLLVHGQILDMKVGVSKWWQIESQNP